MRRHTMTMLLAASCLAGIAGRANAETRTWNGPADGDWFVAGNWQPDDSYPQAGEAVVIPSGSTLLLTNETAELMSFSITNATMTFSNWTACLRAGQVDIRNGGVLNHAPINTNATPGVTNRVYVVGDNLKVWVGGTNFGNARGHRGGVSSALKGQGPGGSDGQSGGRGSGGSYGGKGSATSVNQSGPTYGDHGNYLALQPGSGGGCGASDGGAGGGLIWLEIANTVTVDGTITANGGTASTGGGGGGSGGGVIIRCQSLAMGASGLIRANGGSAGNANGGRGGGGRISVLYVDQAYFGRLRTGDVIIAEEEASLPPPEVASKMSVAIGTTGANTGTAPGTIYFVTQRIPRSTVFMFH